MRREANAGAEDSKPPVAATADEKRPVPHSWSALGEESVRLHGEAARAEKREREARLRLVLGRPPA